MAMEMAPLAPLQMISLWKMVVFPEGTTTEYHQRVPPEGTILIHTSPINPFPPWFSRGFIDIGIQLGRVQYQGDGIYHEFPDYLRCF